MRCAVVRASKGYHSFKINNTYIYFSFPFIHHLNPSVTSQSTQIHHLYFPCITQHPSHSPKDALCHHGAFKHLFFTIWFDTVSLSIMRGQIPSLAISREGTPILFPLQNGNGWTLQCQTTVGHFLSISRPIIPGLINPKRISTNNCRSANQQLSSRDDT